MVSCGPSVPVVTPLPSGKRRHREELFPESGQAPEHLIAVRGKTMIDPDAELILIDRFVVDPAVVVGGPGARSAADIAPGARARPDRMRSGGIVLPGNWLRLEPPAATGTVVAGS